MTPRIAASRLLVLAVLLASGCGGKTTPAESAPPVGMELALESISPAAGAHLVAGSTVTFHAVLRYAVGVSPNGIGALMKDQNGNILASLTTVSVPVGEGVAALGSTFELPASGSTAILIEYDLYTNGAAGTLISAQATASYPVGP